MESQTEGNIINQTDRKWASVAKYAALPSLSFIDELLCGL
jgi:hypothetical protein